MTLHWMRRAAGVAALLAVAGASLAWAAPVSEITGGAVATRQAVRNLPPGATSLAGCPVFPADNPWNAPVNALPVRADSASIIARIQAIGGDDLWPDFAPHTPYGMPITIVPQDQPLVPVTYDMYGAESDPGPMPIPLDARVESGSDRHVLVLQQGTCRLYELFAASRSGAGWTAGSGATFDLRSNALRPERWTSADAAGLPIVPGLVRCEDMAAGRITHAIRVTFEQTRRGYVHPARHAASSSTDPALPAMGMRLRLRAGYDLSAFTGQARIIMEAMKTYGLIVADNGQNWFFQGERADCFDESALRQIRGSVPGTAFEVVDTGPVVPY